MDDIPKAPASRPDLAKAWATVAEMERRSGRAYRDAARRIRAQVSGYEYIGAAELAEIQRLIDTELHQLEQSQNHLLQAGMMTAAGAAVLGVARARGHADADRMLVRYLIDTPQSDGLNLSARLWRIHAGAARDMKSIVDVAVQRGWSAEHALRHTQEITPELQQALDEAGAGAIAKRLEAGLLTDPGNAAMKFRRVLRTEINRAHGERYKQLVREDPDAVGLRFMLSPRHPRVDICDDHATADLYNLGAGVYPVDACPWPAHPNTFSYVEVVYNEQIGTLSEKVGTVDYSFTGDVDVETDQVYTLQGRTYGKQDFIGLAGAADGAKLTVANYRLFTEHRFFEAPVQQTIFTDEDGGTALFLYTDLLVLKPEFRSKGFATAMLTQQVEKARELKFSSLALYADGGYGQNLTGYYAWPRLGFNAPIPEGMRLPDFLQGSRDILDIMASPAGREWWQQNGIPASMEFNLDDDSKSLQAFYRYLNERKD